jgi:hypothetical protein
MRTCVTLPVVYTATDIFHRFNGRGVRGIRKIIYTSDLLVFRFGFSPSMQYCYTQNSQNAETSDNIQCFWFISSIEIWQQLLDEKINIYRYLHVYRRTGLAGLHPDDRHRNSVRSWKVTQTGLHVTRPRTKSYYYYYY